MALYSRRHEASNLSHDLLIIRVPQGIGAYCYVLMAFNWTWDPSGHGTCV